MLKIKESHFWLFWLFISTLGSSIFLSFQLFLAFFFSGLILCCIVLVNECIKKINNQQTQILHAQQTFVFEFFACIYPSKIINEMLSNAYYVAFGYLSKTRRNLSVNHFDWQFDSRILKKYSPFFAAFIICTIMCLSNLNSCYCSRGTNIA